MKDKTKENIWKWIAWILPRELAKWAAIRLWAHATTGKYGYVNATSTTIIEALERWDMA